MMRQLIYDALQALVASGDLKGVYQGESMLKAPNPRDFPIAVYRIGNETNENLGSGSTAYRKFFQVYVHDVPADYSKIDDLIPKIRIALTSAAPSGHVLEIMWRENSRDLDDEFMGSIVRYLRFEAALAQ
jgi:hypothetical protein